MKGVLDPSAAAGLVGVSGRLRQRKRRLGAVVLVCVAAAAVAVWAGLRRYGRGEPALDRSTPYQEAQQVPSSAAAAGAVDSGINRMGPLPSSTAPPISVGDASGIGTSSGAMVAGSKAGSSSISTINPLASILAAVSSTAAATPASAASGSSSSWEAAPSNAPAFQSLQGRLSSGALGLRTCYPKDGAEVVAMSGGSSPCTVLILTKSSRDSYVIRQTINITTPKVRQLPDWLAGGLTP